MGFSFFLVLSPTLSPLRNYIHKQYTLKPGAPERVFNLFPPIKAVFACIQTLSLGGWLGSDCCMLSKSSYGPDTLRKNVLVYADICDIMPIRRHYRYGRHKLYMLRICWIHTHTAFNTSYVYAQNFRHMGNYQRYVVSMSLVVLPWLCQCSPRSYLAGSVLVYAYY